MENVIGSGNSNSTATNFLNLTFKLLFFVVIVFYIFYAFLLTLRVRILADTLTLPNNKFAQTISYIHLVVVLIGSFLALALLLLA